MAESDTAEVGGALLQSKGGHNLDLPTWSDRSEKGGPPDETQFHGHRFFGRRQPAARAPESPDMVRKKWTVSGLLIFRSRFFGLFSSEGRTKPGHFGGQNISPRSQIPQLFVICRTTSWAKVSPWAPTTCCARARKSGHGPEKVDRVRTFDFSVQVFRTFFFGRADQTWTFWRPEYLPPISNSATVCNLPHHFMGEGQPLGADTRSVLDRCVKRWTQPGPPNVVGP